jgi:hypothetical protein
MATRAIKKLDYCPVMGFKVAAGQTATKGLAVLLSGSDEEVATAGANSDLAIGIALNTAAAAAEVQVALFAPVIPAVVGTGDTTRGKKQVLVANGITDAAAHDSSGNTDQAIYGIAMQSGVAGDMVGLMAVPSNRGAA